MAMKNKYAKRSRISEAKLRELVRYVAADLTALQAAPLGRNRARESRPTSPAFFSPAQGAKSRYGNPHSLPGKLGSKETWAKCDKLYTVSLERLSRATKRGEAATPGA